MSADPSQALSDPPLDAPLRVLVVDDEELARLRMRSLVAECTEPSPVVVKGRHVSPVSSLRYRPPLA